MTTAIVKQWIPTSHPPPLLPSILFPQYLLKPIEVNLISNSFNFLLLYAKLFYNLTVISIVNTFTALI